MLNQLRRRERRGSWQESQDKVCAAGNDPEAQLGELMLEPKTAHGLAKVLMPALLVTHGLAL